jgi:hypothetical protein
MRNAKVLLLAALTLSAVFLTRGYALGGSGWSDSTYTDNAGRQVVVVTSMVTHRITCTITWSGMEAGLPTTNVHGIAGIVIPAYPGFGGAIAGHWSTTPGISSFKYTVVCSGGS